LFVEDGMDRDEIAAHLEVALERFRAEDRYLLEHNLSERCIAARIGMYLQERLRPHGLHVDVEYNRAGMEPKRLGVPEHCAKDIDEDGRALVVPDIIVHRRGAGPNVLVVEVKKLGNREGPGCDRERIRALRHELGYIHGALIECEARPGHEPLIRILEWIP
jgi:hypothetical protein